MLSSFWAGFIDNIVDEKDKNPTLYSLVKQLKPIELTESKIVLGCDNAGFAMLLNKRAPLIEKRLSNYTGNKLRLEIVITPKKKRKEEPLFKFEPSIEDVFSKAGLINGFRFDNFAVSSSNQVAYAASQAVSKTPSEAYNPLFLYGGVGVGKTHLAQAVARKILETNPEKKVLFCPGDLFMNELIESIREKNTPRFRRKYRALDLLIVDDIQFISGKNTVQEEFFHTFNTIVSSGGQIILTSDRSPKEIKNLQDRLRSRFSGGLTVDIQAPDFELRTAILLIKAREKNIQIDIDLAKIISDQVTDLRELEGTLLSIYARALTKDGKITIGIVESHFSHEKDNGVRKFGPSDVIRSVCSYYNIKLSHIKGPGRSERVAIPRQVAMFLLRKELGLKYEEIAYILKRKDHTTIMYGVEKINSVLIKDSVFKQEVDRIINSLKQ
ncbi:MAG: chromosomal replication initiator protein DnaA [Candidatus Levybacteria bacterium CG10_big_fil_rev_8_21_14_0_10_35_13]|nr:MAG: chromosomal replication initiator protein DnaA [Candidatus Levybacteria bacterium CG10_big_fil_rev_8_21_14_0_10_35_13]